MKEREQEEPKPNEPARRPYETPHLERLGSVRDLTRGGGGKKNDPAKTPKTSTRS